MYISFYSAFCLFVCLSMVPGQLFALTCVYVLVGIQYNSKKDVLMVVSFVFPCVDFSV